MWLDRLMEGAYDFRRRLVRILWLGLAGAGTHQQPAQAQRSCSVRF